MSFGRPNARQIARKEVAQWFALTPTGTVFLPGDGRVLQLGEEEALAIRASAETKAIEWHVAFENRAWLAIAIVIAVIVGSQSLAAKLPPPWNEGVEAAAYAIYASHAAWMIYEAWSVMKEMRTLRASIGHSLQGRIPLDPSRAGPLGLSNPARFVLIGIGVVLLASNFAAEQFAHFGVDLIGWIPVWLVLPVAVFILIAGLGNWWIDKQRGVGILPPDDLAARVQNRLDRERPGG